jgi:hypothetical protein
MRVPEGIPAKDQRPPAYHLYQLRQADIPENVDRRRFPVEGFGLVRHGFQEQRCQACGESRRCRKNRQSGACGRVWENRCVEISRRFRFGDEIFGFRSCGGACQVGFRVGCECQCRPLNQHWNRGIGMADSPGGVARLGGSASLPISICSVRMPLSRNLPQ